MLKSLKKSARKEKAKRVAVIKNGHAAAELAKSGKRWATHTGSYMSLTDVLAIEATKQK